MPKRLLRLQSCVCVGGGGIVQLEGFRWTACEGEHFRRPVLRITCQPYQMKAYAQMNLLSKLVNGSGTEGVGAHGGGGRD